jgi:hypothetical protein
LATSRTADIRPTINAALVRRLVDTQFPQWSALPLELLDQDANRRAIWSVVWRSPFLLCRKVGRRRQNWTPCPPCHFLSKFAAG